MESVQVERLDHLGVVSGVIKELGLVELIDERRIKIFQAVNAAVKFFNIFDFIRVIVLRLQTQRFCFQTKVDVFADKNDPFFFAQFFEIQSCA